MHSYAATQVKRLLTGNGRAPKSQVQQAICHEFALAAPPEPPDVADAMAIALCHHYLQRELLATARSKLLVITKISGTLLRLDDDSATLGVRAVRIPGLHRRIEPPLSCSRWSASRSACTRSTTTTAILRAAA